MDILKDECPICTEKNLAVTKGTTFQSLRMVCCGTLICFSCRDKMKQSALATGILFKCPICRTLAPKSAKEEFELTLKHAKIGGPWAQKMVGQYYRQGFCVPQSVFEFYSLAAAQGEANA